ncbi:MAG: SDR family oxidoreductase [Candidatus Doudnabacteria bacterium]|nr:SDR family oxidoreductase [Candidatus Doudnabacteria bacterium]
MSFSLKNKVVLVTGSTDGLGKLLVQELARQGAQVIVHGRDAAKVGQLVKHLNEINSKENQSVVCDLNKPEEVGKAFGAIETLDVLINNAGVWEEGDTENVTPERIIELVNVNLASYLLTFRTLLPVLQKSGFSQVLNVISVAGYEVPIDYYHTIYSATKYGLQGFTEATAKEFFNKNLRVMGFYPGGMETRLFKKAGIEYEDKEPWMFPPQESVEAILFMLTRNPKVSVKRMDFINQLEK